MDILIAFFAGAAVMAFLFWTWAAENIGRYQIGEGTRPGGWVHDGELFVPYTHYSSTLISREEDGVL